MARGRGSKLVGAGALTGLVAFAWHRLKGGGSNQPERGREDRIVATTGQVDAAAAGAEAPPPPETVEDPPVESSAPPAAEAADDILVEEQTEAAGAEAAAIGGDAPIADEGFAADPAMRPVVEGSGDAEETREADDREAAGNRKKRS